MNFEQENLQWQNFPFELLSATISAATRTTPPIVRSNYSYLTIEYVVRGEGFLEINDHKFHVKSDSIYFLTPHSDHRYWPNRRDPWEKLFFNVTGNLVDQLLHTYLLQDIYCIPDCPELKKYFGEIRELTPGKIEANLQGAVIFHALLAACAQLVYRPREVSPGAQRLHREIEQHVESRFSLSDYARKHHISTSALIRSFRQCFGVTPHEYLLQCKFENARRLLSYSDLSIKEIAEKLAFSDQYHFSNSFKKWCNLSPSELRKRSSR